MRFNQSPLVTVRRTKDKGWAVFARRFIPADTVIEEVPVLVLPSHDLYHPNGTSCLSHHVFVWDDDNVAIALGYGSLYNHSYCPNARYVDDEPCVKRYYALRDIQPREEITINYNADPDDLTDVGFDVRS